MLSKNLKLLILAGSTSIAVGAGVAFTSSKVGNLAFRSRADETLNSSITFNTSCSRSSLGSNKYSFESKTTYGETIHIFSKNSNTLSNSSLCTFTDSKSEYLIFTVDSAGNNGYKFQSMTSVAVTTSSNKTVLCYVESSDGKTFTDASPLSLSATTSGATKNLDGARYLKLTPSASNIYTFDVTEVTINFSCSYSYEEPSSGLSGVYTCSQSSSYTLDFDKGEYRRDYYGSTYTMKFTVDGTTLIYSSGNLTDFGNGYRLFSNESTPNATLSIVSDTSFTITLYGMGSSSTKTFNKA